MLCQKCHKNLATVRYAEVVNGKVTDLHLCPECLSRQQETAASGFELGGPVPSASGISTGVVQRRLRTERARLKAPRTCRSCGSQLAKVLDSGKVGCTQCYKIFHEEVDPMLAALHGGTQHRGKASRVRDVRVRLRTDLQTKRALLRSALETENYEEAAALRDDIKQLEMVLGAALTASVKDEG